MKELEELVAFMKANGVLHARFENVEATLSPNALAPAPDDNIKFEPEDVRIGTTGMTKRQQEELFGTYFAEDFEEAKR